MKESEQDPNDPKAWESEIKNTGLGVAIIYQDGSLLDWGRVGGGTFVVE